MFDMEGLKLLPGFLDILAQRPAWSLAACACVAVDAPLYQPAMPATGKPLSVRMTNLGELGWISDRKGYRYQAHHPVTGKPWPAIPSVLLDIWRTRRLNIRTRHKRALSITMRGLRAWGCTRIAMKMISMRRSCRFRWAIPQCSGSVGSTRKSPTRSAQAHIGRCGGAGRSCKVVSPRHRPHPDAGTSTF
jgi:hypothetical protein